MLKSAGGAMPVPLNDAVCGELAALSLTVNVPGSEPAVAGLKVTLMVQVEPAASVDPQVVVAL
jgi:hypothetical protein